jgi:N-acetylglucosaminyl-diphospho-decaprenol L-rhamnosyltransferase
MTAGLEATPTERGAAPAVTRRRGAPADLAVVLVSYNQDRWLRACLTSLFAHAGRCSLDVVVVANGDDGTAEFAAEFPDVRFLRCENRGFAHANNHAIVTCDARHVLLLNVDTAFVSGTLESLVRLLDDRPEIGVLGVRQLDVDGSVAPTIRYFPSVLRALCESLGSERWPARSRFCGERELAAGAYEREQACDWVSGSFLLARRQAIAAAGLLDERFFLYSEEPDFCLRVKRCGWGVVHSPLVTIVHHGASADPGPRLTAQNAFARMQYARKHFAPWRRELFRAAIGIGYLARAGAARTPAGRVGARLALRTVVGLAEPPFGAPAARAVTTQVDGRP